MGSERRLSERVETGQRYRTGTTLIITVKREKNYVLWTYDNVNGESYSADGCGLAKFRRFIREGKVVLIK